MRICHKPRRIKLKSAIFIHILIINSNSNYFGNKHIMSSKMFNLFNLTLDIYWTFSY